jgi:integrase
MAGSIRPRPDKGANAWELRVFLGRDSKGKVRHRSRLVRGSRRQAERELAAMLVHTAEAPAPVPEERAVSWGPSTTINDALAAWKANGWEDLSPSTTMRYENLWKVHIREGIGRKPIAALSSYELERWFRELKRSGQSEASVRQARALINRACRLARKWSGGVLPNPVAETELPAWGLHESAEPVRAPSLDEVQALLAAARAYDPRFAALLRLVAASGARRGEVCALRWSDVDFDTSSLTFDESVVIGEGRTLIRGPKTRASVRTVALDRGTISELVELRRVSGERAGLCGLALERDAFVFSGEPGGATPLHPDTVSHGFAVIRKRAGVAADIHLHSLRHFHATVLDPLVSERQKQSRLGWATVHMARHYTDSIPEEDRRAADHVGRLLNDER